jgi:hypothetical protein
MEAFAIFLSLKQTFPLFHNHILQHLIHVFDQVDGQFLSDFNRYIVEIVRYPGIRTWVMLPRLAAGASSVRPPIGEYPAAQGNLTGHRELMAHRRLHKTETRVVAMVIPADGPSFGIAPSGTWI